MTESFAALFEESELNLNVEKGAVIQGVVVNIDSDWVTVDTGLKSEGVVDRAEFLNEQRELEVQVGDEVDVVHADAGGALSRPSRRHPVPRHAAATLHRPRQRSGR